MPKTKKPRSKSRKSNAPKRDPYQVITDRIVSALESGDVAPWHKPWKVDARGSSMPHNAASGHGYRGINIWLCLATQTERGYSSNGWLTFKQANEVASKAAKKAGRKVEKNDRGAWVYADGDDKGKSCGGVRKGQNKANDAGGTEIVFWKRMVSKKDDEKTGEEKTRVWFMLRFFTVFNVDQCDDAVRDYLNSTPVEAREFTGVEAAEKICEGYDVTTKHGGDRAYYDILADRIQLPKRESFKSAEHYYSTRFHEMGHSTGAKHRLDRPGITDFDFFGTHQYAEEELVAEFTACFLCGEAGIERAVEGNSVNYLHHWSKKLRENNKLVVFAAQRAQKAADFVLGREGKSDEEPKASTESAA